MPEINKGYNIYDASHPIRVLLVDDDKDFIQYALSASAAFNISLTTCETVQETLAQLEKKQFDAFIIDLKLPDGSGFDIVKEIRKKSSNPIAVVTGVFHDEENFRLLKEKYTVNYILDKPVYRDQIESLFRALSGYKQLEESSLPPEKQQKLQEYYAKTIPDKIDLFTKLIAAIHHHPDEESLSRLKDAAHKIGGSSGSYGYHSISKICKELECDIKRMLEGKVAPSIPWIGDLNLFLHRIKYYFQFPDAQTSGRHPSSIVDYGFRHTFYVVDTNEKLLGLIEKEKENYKLDLIIERDPALAMQHLKTPNFNPGGLLVANSYPGCGITGFEIIESMQKKAGYLSTVTGLILDEEDFNLRIKAAKKGIDHLFVRPISANAVLETYARKITLPYLENFKVLILDDDIDVCTFAMEAFSEIGLLAKAIHNPSALYSTLEEFVPQVLLLDILLPGCDGLNLLKSLRADPTYENLAVIIVTNYTEDIVNEVAYGEHALEVMYKPLEKKRLQKHILDLAKQLMVKGYFHPLQSRIDLETLPALLLKLREILERANIEDRCLILFEIEHFDGLVLEKGRAYVNRLLVSIGNLLIESENIRRKSFFIEPCRFAMLTAQETAKTVEENVKELLLAARSESNASITLSAAVVPLSKRFKESKDVFLAAEEGLNLLKSEESAAPVKIKLCVDNLMKQAKQDILYVDPDQNLQKLIRSALEPCGLKVISFSNGEEFLNALNQYEESHLPALIIVERKLSDMDGLELLLKVKYRFRQSIPFYFLTVYSSDQDISHALKEGALEYITKPFNLSLLVQKILSITNAASMEK